LEEMMTLLHTGMNGHPPPKKCAVMVVGTKTDKPREVTKEEGVLFAKKHKALYAECCTRPVEFCSDEIFEQLMKHIVYSGFLDTEENGSFWDIRANCSIL